MWRDYLALSVLTAVFLCCSTPSGDIEPPNGLVDSSSTVPAASRVSPMYPQAAVEARIEGRVVVDLTVARSGQVVGAVVVESEPPGVFDKAVLDAVSQWQYRARTEGEPDYPDPVRVAIPFRIGS
jgi:protein TonB